VKRASTPVLATLAALALAALAGCYRSHEIDPLLLPDGARLDGGAPRDTGIVLAPDARLGRDAGDGGLPPLDAPLPGDAGTDARIGRDAEPRIQPPPDPTTCRIEPEIHPFRDPVLERRWPENGGAMTETASVHVCATTVVADLQPNDGEDLQPVVVFASYDSLGDSEHGTLRIWDPRSETTISYPEIVGPMGPFGPLEPSTNLAVGDLDGDGDLEIVGMGVNSGSFAFHHDGTLFWESGYPTAVDRGLRWSRTIGGAITLADLEGDGEIEVIAGRNVIEGRTGELRWTGDRETTTRGANGSLGPIACVSDLDDDGDLEVIAGRTAMRAEDGSILWSNHALQDGLCAIGDVIAGSPGEEVVVSSDGWLYVLRGSDGEVLWDRIIEGRGRDALGGPPTVADFDGDGTPEMGVAHGSAYAVYDPDCVRGSGGCIGTGLRWVADTEDDSSAATGSSVFDFNGDGSAEVVYNDQFNFRVFRGTDGEQLFEQANSSRTRTENPVIVDVDADGDAEIVFSANSEAFYLRPRTTDPGVEIWGDARGRWVGARRIWNQHAYSISNVEENGRITSPEVLGSPALNAFRQNLREGGDVLVVPDLWSGRGSYECVAPGMARFSIDVQNWGLERIGAGVIVRFYRGRPSGGEVVGTAATTGVLLPEGGSEVVSIDVPLGGEVGDYWAVLDAPDSPADGAIAECREDNNEVLIWRPSCP
jgi:hypothetical protein